MKVPSRMDRIGRAAPVAAAAILALSFGAGALAQQGGGRPAGAGSSMRTVPTLPAQATSRQPATLPAAPAAAEEAGDNAASATTTVEHTEGGIERTTTVTNKNGTMTGSTTVDRDDETGTRTVTTTRTGFDGETRSVENTVTKTEEGAEHTLTKGEGEEEDDAASDEPSPPES